MPQYGIIYIAQNRKLGDNVFKVGRSEFSIDEKLEELNGSTENGKYESVAFFVVSDIISADESCQENLASYKGKDPGLFELEFAELMSVVNETIAPYKAFDYEKDCLLIGGRAQESGEQKPEETEGKDDSQKEEKKGSSNQAKPTTDALVFLLILILIGLAAFWKVTYGE
jgi:hypothetical protein